VARHNVLACGSKMIARGSNQKASKISCNLSEQLLVLIA